MAAGPPVDPARDDVRPVVGIARGVPTWLFAAAMAALALVLFVILDSHRRAADAPAVRVADTSPVTPAAIGVVPPLYIPPAPPPPPAPERVRVVLAPRAPVYAPPPGPPPRYAYSPAPPPMPTPPPSAAPDTGGHATSDSALVYDATAGDAAATVAPTLEGSGGVAAVPSAVRASLLRHVATTVPQGTLIPATLETALDSTRPGLARAVVSRDVVGGDGSRVLIPRGSKLIGDYRSDVQRGQKRLLVTWTRLVRPDNASIALASPSADPLGRIGVAGKVDSHFFERFAGAILQSALDIGVTLASRSGSGNSIAVVGTPGAFSGSSPSFNNGTDVTPTLRTRQGVSIDVFVARDLDFTAVERRR